MTKTPNPRGMTRRELLKRGTALGTAFVAGSGFLAHATGAWAMEIKALSPQTMGTLVQMARDIYPHDRVADRFYAAAVKAHDEAAAGDAAVKEMIETGIADLDARAKAAGNVSYLDTGWEADRVALLREIDATPFFQAVRGGLITGLYNNKEVWPIFGYQGESYSQGGYIDRGFNDIDWL